MIYLNGHLVDFKTFPNGESFADVERNCVKSEGNEIKLKFETDKDILYLKFVKDFVDDCALSAPCSLVMPYIPYSRMDRKEENRLFTLKTIASMINAMNFEKVVVYEPHSDVSVGLLDRVQVVNQSSELVLDAVQDILDIHGSIWRRPKDYVSYDEDMNIESLFEKAKEKGIYFVYPDAGAEKRYKKQIKYENTMTCSKERDFNTGRIKSIVLNGADKAENCKIAIIVDDLSSKGGTFIGTAQELHKVFGKDLKVFLCVTHCENTIFDGDVFKSDEIDKVYTTDSIIPWHSPDWSEDCVRKLKIKNIF